MLVLNLPFKALMFLTLMRPSLVLFLVLWLKLVKDFLKVRCRLALLPFLISCLIWLDLVASLRSEERFSRNAETEIVCRLLLEKKKMSLAKIARSGIKPRVAEVLEEVGLGPRASHFPNELSSGEMQRVAIARAVIHRPPLILADEPTGNLDSKNGEMILDLIRGIHKSRRPTVVMATHSERAAAYGDYVVEVADGRLFLS